MDILGGGGGAPGGGAPSGGGVQGPGTPNIPRNQEGGNPEDAAREAGKIIRQAIELEVDEADRLQLEEIASRIQKYIASQQDLADTATGAGPGAKVMRKMGPGA